MAIFSPMVGFNRAGTTLLSSLLDAHPKIAFGNEIELVKRITNRNVEFKESDFMRVVIPNVKSFTREGKKWTDRQYLLPINYSYQDTTVYGDKKAAQSADIFGRNPAMIEKLYRLVTVDIKPLIIVRNPFDVIAAVFNRKDCMVALVKKGNTRTLDDVIQAHKPIIRGIETLLEKKPETQIIYYESLLSMTQTKISYILKYYGLSPDEQL